MEPITLSCATCPVGPGERCPDCIVFLMVSPEDRLAILTDAAQAGRNDGE